MVSQKIVNKKIGREAESEDRDVHIKKRCRKKIRDG